MKKTCSSSWRIGFSHAVNGKEYRPCSGFLNARLAYHRGFQQGLAAMRDRSDRIENGIQRLQATT